LAKPDTDGEISEEVSYYGESEESEDEYYDTEDGSNANQSAASQVAVPKQDKELKRDKREEKRQGEKLLSKKEAQK